LDFRLIGSILIVNQIHRFSFHHIDSVRVARNPPRKQIFVAKVLGGLTVPSFGALVDNLDNFIDKNDNLILQTFCRLSELSDTTEAEDKLNPLSRRIKVQAWINLDQRVGDYASTQLAETSLQQGTDFKYCQLQHLRLHLMPSFFLLNRVNRLFQRIFSESLNDFNDLLNRLNHNSLRIVAKNYKSHRKDATSENSGTELEDSLHSRAVGVVYTCISDKLFTTL